MAMMAKGMGRIMRGLAGDIASRLVVLVVSDEIYWVYKEHRKRKGKEGE